MCDQFASRCERKRNPRTASAWFGACTYQADALRVHVRPDDAGAVGTEVGALVQKGRCPSVFFSTRMRTCFGYMNRIDADTVARFSVPWWFRTEFSTRLRRAEHVQLIVNGVVGP